MNQSYYSPKQIAGLPGMPKTESGVIRWSDGKLRKTRKELGMDGKGWMIHISCLPKETQNALLEQLLKSSEPEPAPQEEPNLPGFTVADRPVMKLPSRSAQTDRQRNAEYARGAILAEVRRLERAGVTRERAIQTVIRLAAEGGLPPVLQELVAVANDKANESRGLSRRSIFRWIAAEEKGQLAPKLTREKKFEIPPWGAKLLREYRKPQKPSLRAALERITRQLPPSIPAPSYDQARRWLDKLGNVERIRGRLGPRELRTVLPFTRRSTDGLWPMDIVLPDGHCFDAEVQHPFHGQPFRPEITTYVDIATRRVVGWGIDLAESSAAILATLRHMILAHGVPCIHYSDRGAYRAATFSDAVTGILPRLGIEQEFSIAYNSQARGAIERLHQTLWVGLARELSTFIGADMDKQAKQIAFKTTRKDGRGLIGWEDFLRLCAERVAWYNAHAHRSLGGLSPNASWQKAIGEGWEPVLLDGDDLDDLLPEVLRTVQRGEISLPWGRYFSHDLREWNGDQVRVRYDLHEGQQVWVRSLEGRLIATAQRDGNSRPYFSESAIDHARDQREKGRIERAQRKIDEAKAERRGFIEAMPEAAPLPLDLQLTKNRMEVTRAEAQPTAGEPAICVQAVRQATDTPQAASEFGSQPLPGSAEAGETPAARYAAWKSLDEALHAGEALTPEEYNRWEKYQRSREFVAMRRREMEQAA